MTATTLTRTVGVLAVLALVELSGSAGVTPTAIGAPTSLVVFGDSLSDMGNVADATGGVVPGSSYYGDRFSNGPAWVEHLASDLGLTPLQPSTSGGTNYAYGGARTSGTSFFEGGAFIKDVDEQLNEYLRGRVADPQALYVMYIGANDLFAGQSNVSIPITRIAGYLERLVSAGAREIVVPNLPLLGRIPMHNRDPGLAAAFDQRTVAYNALFESTIEGLAVKHPTATFYRLDVAEIFTAAIERPADWGLTNVTDPAAPGLDPGAVFYNDDRVVAHPEEYLFWDTIHPTAVIHEILGDYANALLTGLPGDFDADGEVDGADLGLLNANFGAMSARRRQGDANGDGTVDGVDLLAWQRHAGENILAIVKPKQWSVVPEPERLLLAFLGGVASIRRRRASLCHCHVRQ